jgi:ribosomal protein S27E/ribosomal protein L34
MSGSAPMRNVCSNCGWDYELRSETLVFVYRAEPESSLMRTTCPSCGNVTFTWQVPRAVVHYIRAHNRLVKWAQANKPPNDLVRMRLHQFGWRSRLNTQELRQILFYRRLMSQGAAPEQTWPDRESLAGGRLDSAWPDQAEMIWLKLMCIYQSPGR